MPQDNEVKYYITPVGRLSYTNVWNPRRKKPGEEAKANVYDTTLIMDKIANMTPEDKRRFEELKKLVEFTKTQKWPTLRVPVSSPFRSGKEDQSNEKYPLDFEKNPEYRNKIIIKAVSYNRQPKVRRPDKTEMMDQSELYSGCYARLWVNAFAYDNAGNKGISFGLQGIMKVRDGEPLSGQRRIEDAFKEIEVEEDTFATVEDDTFSDI